MSNDTHQPTKVLETEQVIVFDNFLPTNEAEALHTSFIGSDFEYINTGKVSRAWRIRDGFPLRGRSLFYHANKPEDLKASWIYPSNTPLDVFIDGINNINHKVSHIVGEPEKDWKRFSVTEWIYQSGTGLSLHDDGSNTYSGAYTYFLNKEWNLHWGGILLVVDKSTDSLIEQFKNQIGEYKYWKEKWLADDAEAILTSELGLGQFIFPKFNRIVFIKNNANHMVTNVLPSAGDRTRKSLAGFFHIRSEGAAYS